MDRLAYRPEEAAEVTGLGRTKMFALLASGEIESVKVGRARLVPADALAAFLAARREQAASDRTAA